MRIIIIADSFSPQNTSAAVQLRDLADEFISRNVDLLVIAPNHKNNRLINEKINKIKLLRVPINKEYQRNYIFRTISELTMPFSFYFFLLKSKYKTFKPDLVVWYSPSIFFGILILLLKLRYKFHAYLILRDIFPEWANDLGLIKKSLPYYFFKFIASLQYFAANTIGVQSKSNIKYVKSWVDDKCRNIEVLENWQSKPTFVKKCSIQISKTKLKGKKIFCYLGNMGVAQSMDFLIDLAEKMKNNQNVGFLFVGRGSEWERLRKKIIKKDLKNILIYKEIDSTQISDLTKQCHYGLIALDPRHTSHNIPGKFLTYMFNGLPVLARLNPNTDLEEIIKRYKIGFSYTGYVVEEFQNLAERLLNLSSSNSLKLSKSCLNLAKKHYSSSIAVDKILKSVKN